MLDEIDLYEGKTIDLATLCSNLKGLLGASDLKSAALIDDFWTHFMELDMELELRTEDWAPVGAASDERLAAALLSYRAWVRSVLATSGDDRT